MGTKPEISQRYPKNIELDEGQVPAGPSFLCVRPGGQPQVRPVSLRLMGAADKAAILQFAYSLPQEDLLFLRSDITDPANADEWIESIEKGATVTLLAEPERHVVGLRQPPREPASMDAEGRRDSDQHSTRVAIQGPSERGSARRLWPWPAFWSLEKSPRRWWRTIKAPGRCSRGWAFMWKRCCQTG